MAGEFGVPLIFLSSDEQGCDEARRFMPWIETVPTKQGLGRNCAYSKHPAVVAEEIYTGVRQAVKRIGEMRSFTFDHPARIEIQFKKVTQAIKARIRRRGWCLTGPKTILRILDNMLDWRC